MSNLEIYTDGACSTNGTWNGGASMVVIVDGVTEYVYSEYEETTTNNRMELKGLIFALDFIKENKLNSISVYTDSAYCCNCLDKKWYINWRKNGWRNSKKEEVKNKDLWEQLLSLYEDAANADTKIIKVKGHSTNLGNCEADKYAVLAKEGKRNVSINNKSFSNIKANN